jgi:hypothetical protein
MPEREVIERGHRDAEEGKSPSTQAGEFVREEIEHVRQGKHGARSPMQAIAIGLSKARRAGIDLPPPKKSRSSQKVRRQAERDLRKGHSGRRKTSARRSRASSSALRRESRSSVSRARLPMQAIAIGLSKARRAGIDLPPPKKSRCSQKVLRKSRSEDLGKAFTRKFQRSAPGKPQFCFARAALQAGEEQRSKARPRSAASRLDRRGSHEGTHRPAKGGCESGKSPPAPRLGSG